MSVSGIGDSTISSLSPELLAQMRGGGGRDDEDFAASFIEKNDGDGDGLLSLEEAGIGEDQFTATDTDGDGFISQEEIQADMENRRKQMGMMGELGMLMQGVGGQPTEGQNLVDSIISEKDADGDGLLSQGETGLSSELFSSLDTDGDGQLSSEELDAALRPPDMGAGMGAEQASAGQGSQQTQAASGGSSSSGSSSSSDDDDYDQYDLNEDGVVTMEELHQAFLDGDTSLAQLFQDEKTGEQGQSPLLRMAMQAYQMQGASSFSGSQMAVA